MFHRENPRPFTARPSRIRGLALGGHNELYRPVEAQDVQSLLLVYSLSSCLPYIKSEGRQFNRKWRLSRVTKSLSHKQTDFFSHDSASWLSHSCLVYINGRGITVLLRVQDFHLLVYCKFMNGRGINMLFQLHDSPPHRTSMRPFASPLGGKLSRADE